MERFMPRNTLNDIRCDRWGLSQRERKKNPRASQFTLTWGHHTNRHNTDFPSLQNQTEPDHGVVEEVTACSVGVGAACKAWGFPYFLLHVIIYFLKLNHALLMVPNAIGNAASSIITSLKRAKEKKILYWLLFKQLISWTTLNPGLVALGRMVSNQFCMYNVIKVLGYVTFMPCSVHQSIFCLLLNKKRF